MNTSLRKLATVGAVAALAVSSITACSNDDSAAEGGDKSLEIVYWNYGPAAETGNKATADAFMAANAGTTVKLTPVTGENWGTYYANVATLIASGQRPDLMVISGEGAQFVHANNLVRPINEYLEKDADAKAITGDIAQGLIDGFTVKKDVVTLTYGWNNMVVYYNTDVFKKAGVEPPEADWTWADFQATAKKLTADTNKDGKTDTYGFTWASNEIFPGIMPWVANAGGNLTSDDVCAATADTAQVTKAVSFLRQLITDGVSPAPMPMSDVFTRFQNGQVAMFGAGRWPIGTFLPAGFKSFDIQLYPKGDTYKTVFGGAGYPILKSSKNPDLAWEYQKFTVSEQIEKQYVGTPEKPGDSIPSRRSLAQTISKVGVLPANSDLYYDSIDKFPTLVPYPAPAKYSAFESTVLRHLQLIFAGETSVADGLKAMQGELSSIVTC
ncbi:sugar ABC transporter substrate-binding protein [Actinoplanes sp. TRM 88003]|uniref:Sugar ABC transporter substrate-binding protein n=1 Tax=Paractinoplanes aksuensis TaxID=2939490 RepID=A0ABT1DNU2_9ACTN|nr:sugar ABC transporter substrate-binding protein [Actinoplanes aksuensis]MCO8271705.1 sugar ABC transporter substrate-binding protein [Actinoplanes aksuensis]